MEPRAAVAIVESDDRVLLLRRRPHPRDPWSDHWALPGGRRDDGDADLLATACREAAEEAGLELGPVCLVATLPPRLAGRHVGHAVLVQPFHFRLPQLPELRPDPVEVAALRWLECAALCDLSRHRHGPHALFRGAEMPYVQVDDHPLWGFTYGLLCDWVAQR